jgi:protein-L-isoaspartate(D-aspartate) O-methyltransferase
MNYAEQMRNDTYLPHDNMIVSQLRPNGINDPALLSAFKKIPREIFVAPALKSLAYSDSPLPGDQGRFLMAPLTIAKLFQLADIKEKDSVLVVGYTSGYTLALASFFTSSLYAQENHPYWIEESSKNLRLCEKDLGISYVTSPLSTNGFQNQLFDVIIFDGAVPEIPQSFINALKENGRIVAVLKHPSSLIGRGTLIQKTGATVSHLIKFDVETPLLPDFTIETTFNF